MKRKWQIIMALVLALVTVMTIVIPALAQDEEPSTAASRGGALAIIAPWMVPAGQEFTVRTFLRENQEAFPGVGVWAVSADAATSLREVLGQSAEDTTASAVQDYESLLEAYGTYLGRTGEDGRLICVFEQAGRYILIAGRNGYLPGFTHIGVRETVNALGIRAPQRAPAGETVSLTVYERINLQPVGGAGVWAVSRDNIEALKQEVESLRENSDLSAEEPDYEALVGLYGMFLGRTGEDGSLEFILNEAGGYLLVAVKRGYFPGFSPIRIYEKREALSILANPPRAIVGEPVSLYVSERQSHAPVEGAGVWAISRDQAEALQSEITALRESSVAATEIDYEAVISRYGMFLGRTGPGGELGATFDNAGVYLLVTAKKGYLPGFTLLPVREKLRPESAEPEGRAERAPLEPQQTKSN